VAERNLDRITYALLIIWTATIVALAGTAGADAVVLRSGRVIEAERLQPLEIGREFAGALRGDIEGKGLDRNGTVLLGIVAAKDGSEHADADLMDHAESAEGRGRWRARRRISGQRRTLLS